jgi:hypothetical protein
VTPHPSVRLLVLANEWNWAPNAPVLWVLLTASAWRLEEKKNDIFQEQQILREIHTFQNDRFDKSGM